MMLAALHFELLKLRRAAAVRATSLLVLIVVPAMSAGLLALVRSGAHFTLADKVAPLLQGTGWTALTGFSAQIMAVGTLLAFGVVVSWSFGREFTDGTFGALFALPTSRAAIAVAKLIVLVLWGLALSIGTALTTLLAGVAIGLGIPDGSAWTGVVRILVVGLLTVMLTLPLALVASAGRGYLVAIAGLLGVVVLTQIVVALGAGAWFPYAAPSIWAGLGGAGLAAAVTPAQLLLAFPVGVAGAFATTWWWRRAQVL